MTSLRQLVGRNLQSARLRGTAAPPPSPEAPRRRNSQESMGMGVAEVLGHPWTRQQVSRAETGGRAFTVDELVALAVALDVTVVDLLRPDGALDYRTEDGSISASQLRRALGLAEGPSLTEFRDSLSSLKGLASKRERLEAEMGGVLERVVRSAEALALRSQE